MAQSEIGIDFIHKQIEECDTIVENIDKIVPKLYKIRQQALSQKDYVNDVTNILLQNVSSIDAQSKSITLKNTAVSTDLQNLTSLTNLSLGTAGNVDNKKLFQSLFKYKHDIGTNTHFTTEQIGSTVDRTSGLHLNDVVNITSGLNELLKQSSTTPGPVLNVSDKILQKQITSPESVAIEPTESDSLFADSRTAASYKINDTTNVGHVVSGFSAISSTDTFVGFGLSD